MKEIELLPNLKRPKTSVGMENSLTFVIRFNIRRNRPNQISLLIKLMNSNNNLQNYGNC
jgi:hypothetical protein